MTYLNNDSCSSEDFDDIPEQALTCPVSRKYLSPPNGVKESYLPTASLSVPGGRLGQTDLDSRKLRISRRDR